MPQVRSRRDRTGTWPRDGVEPHGFTYISRGHARSTEQFRTMAGFRDWMLRMEINSVGSHLSRDELIPPFGATPKCPSALGCRARHIVCRNVFAIRQHSSFASNAAAGEMSAALRLLWAVLQISRSAEFAGLKRPRTSACGASLTIHSTLLLSGIGPEAASRSVRFLRFNNSYEKL